MMNRENLRRQQFDCYFPEYHNGDFREWLDNKGFFTAPASAGHHGNYAGGLFDHSFEVMLQLGELTCYLDLEWEKRRSPYLVGMFHDLCKIDAYKQVNGVYQYDDDAPKGHGDKSILYLSKFVDLTREEELCIRWHMGAFDEKENWQHYTDAIREYSNVLWTHTADMYASQTKGI